jgi:hypothetical protein
MCFPQLMNEKPIYYWVATFGLVVGSLVFFPGIGGGFVFDDATSIEPLRQLREYPELFWPMVFSNTSGPLGRSISILSFALEQRYLSAGVALTQSISIGIHAINALLVFWLLRMVFGLLGIRGAYVFAFFGSFIWAFAPQKVSSVLYMVQRMTLLAAFFSLLACCSFLSARSFLVGKARSVMALLCVFSTAVAPFAKENGLLVLPFLISIEIFIVPHGKESSRARNAHIAAIFIALLGVAFYLYLGFIEYLRSDSSYSLRSFTFFDRLSSIPLMLTDYMLQFFIPNIEGMGVFHDDFAIASRRPGRAFLTGIVVVGAVGYVLNLMRTQQRSLFGFGVAFFLIGHGIESSFLPLELFFEHRNYVPSVGLVACLCSLLAQALPAFSKPAQKIAAVGGVAYLLVSASATATLSGWWSSTYFLVQHQVLAHQNSSRAHSENALYEAAAGRFEDSLASINRAYELSRSQPAARSMGTLDRALMFAAASCLARNKSLVPPFQTYELIEPRPIRLMPIHLLLKLYEGEECLESEWGRLSEWLQELVLQFGDHGVPIGKSSLIGLARLEQARRNPTGAFMYSAMAIEDGVDDGSALLIMAEASLVAGDLEAFTRITQDLATLADANALSRVNLAIFRRMPAPDEIADM